MLEKIHFQSKTTSGLFLGDIIDETAYIIYSHALLLKLNRWLLSMGLYENKEKTFMACYNARTSNHISCDRFS